MLSFTEDTVPPQGVTHTSQPAAIQQMKRGEASAGVTHAQTPRRLTPRQHHQVQLASGSLEACMLRPALLWLKAQRFWVSRVLPQAQVRRYAICAFSQRRGAPADAHLGTSAGLVILWGCKRLRLVALWLALPEPVVVLDTGGLEGAAQGGVCGGLGGVAFGADATAHSKQRYLRAWYRCNCCDVRGGLVQRRVGRCLSPRHQRCCSTAAFRCAAASAAKQQAHCHATTAPNCRLPGALAAPDPSPSTRSPWYLRTYPLLHCHTTLTTAQHRKQTKHCMGAFAWCLRRPPPMCPHVPRGLLLSSSSTGMHCQKSSV